MKNLTKQLTLGLALVFGLTSCSSKSEKKVESNQKLSGTYRLIESKTIKGKDTIVAFTDTLKTEMFKMFNDDHFSFFNHDKEKGKGKEPLFVSGGGTYSLKGSQYQENLQYCSMREWENNTFHFVLTQKGDTLIQKGEENLPELGIKQIIIETYIKLK
ncbi:hypothetical protein LZQ00_01620 [Sphingobacterium sp. SRCM116780]|uniref:hypothetical protein n=1 Tax=Sphingobacterium sp. SRCM116780 TaxID=2907623 RepID=UPI001F44473A|nr:hypothetical protein [Sphingobacterium sp. SRCM116780]UIR56532.1 hypothetical protein LZQ00_01620 [Sphingobacterium sp. SRCM116780]